MVKFVLAMHEPRVRFTAATLVLLVLHVLAPAQATLIDVHSAIRKHIIQAEVWTTHSMEDSAQSALIIFRLLHGEQTSMTM